MILLENEKSGQHTVTMRHRSFTGKQDGWDAKAAILDNILISTSKLALSQSKLNSLLHAYS